MTKQKLILLLTLVAVFLLLGLIRNGSNAPEPESKVLASTNGTAAEEKLFWRQQIKEKGGKQAHNYFFEIYKDLSEPEKHDLLHLFGESLYDVLGNEGIKYCDTRVAYACYHGFMSKPSDERGLEAIKFFGQECYRLFGDSDPGCKHGLGHILLEYLGDDQIGQALEVCKTFPKFLPLGGCAGGVFMEYHTFDIRQIENPALTFRPLDTGNPHDPCPDLAGEFQPACYFALPKWWNLVFNGDFAKIGGLCSEATSEEVKNICWEGTGWLAVQIGQYNPTQTLEACSKMPNSSGRDHCQIGAAWTFNSSPDSRNDKKGASLMCANLAEDLKKKCRIDEN